MNLNQIKYSMSTLRSRNPFLGMALITGAFGLYNGYKLVVDYNQEGLNWGLLAKVGVSGLLAAEFFGLGWKKLPISLDRFLHKREVKKSQDMFPLDHAENIEIKDISGLENLLWMTGNGKSDEWGTFIMARYESGTILVYELFVVAKADNTELINEPSFDSLGIDKIGVVEKGFNGVHHYHPTRGKNIESLWSCNYAISDIDRLLPPNLINFITFNTPHGPEIIAYNRVYTYIPTDDSKTHLKKASFMDILRYLN